MGVGATGPIAALSDWTSGLESRILPADHRLLEQALFLFEHANVHLPVRRRDGYDPLPMLRQLIDGGPNSRPALYGRLLEIFAGFGDRHSRIVLPSPWNESFAYLPLVIGRVGEGDDAQFIVTGSADPRLRKGRRVYGWNDRPLEAVLRRHMRLQHGANEAARAAKALQTLTIRPLALMPPPAGPVTLSLGETRRSRQRVRLQWRVTDEGTLGHLLADCRPPVDGFESRPFGLRFRIFASRDGKQVGWLKIPSLRVPPDTLTPVVCEILAQAPETGLVLDLRGCEEGFIPTGEALLQLFSKSLVGPIAFQFRVTDWMTGLVGNAGALAAWQGAMITAAAARKTYTEARAISSADELAAIPQRYGGRLLVLVDALTYSTAEMVASSLQDHGMAQIVGTAGQTGGGGGSPWDLSIFAKLAGEEWLSRPKGGASLQIAVRRNLRSHRNAGKPLEGAGVIPDIVLRPTERDLLEADVDLTKKVISLFQC